MNEIERKIIFAFLTTGFMGFFVSLLIGFELGYIFLAAVVVGFIVYYGEQILCKLANLKDSNSNSNEENN